MRRHWHPYGIYLLIQAFYPNYPYQLSAMAREHKKEGTFFKESELWYLLYTLSSAKNALPNHKIGDARLENVFADGNGRLKVVNCYSWPN